MSKSAAARGVGGGPAGAAPPRPCADNAAMADATSAAVIAVRSLTTFTGFLLGMNVFAAGPASLIIVRVDADAVHLQRVEGELDRVLSAPGPRRTRCRAEPPRAPWACCRRAG